MNVVYRISSPDDTSQVAYATNCVDADKIAAIMINNGYRAKVRRINRRDVPMQELELITLITANDYEH